MDILRSTMVEAAFRPAAEEARSLLDFVDEQGVETMRDALKESIRESRVCPQDSIPSLSNILYRRHRQNLTRRSCHSTMTSAP